MKKKIETEQASPQGEKKINNAVIYLGNQWDQCLPLSEDTILEVEKEMGISLPQNLKNLFVACNGGEPKKSYLATDRYEVVVGSLLPIRPPKSYKGDNFEDMYNEMIKLGLSSTLLPFACDNGNSGIFCLNSANGEIVYWVQDDLKYPIKKIVNSLSDFLSGLETPPF